MTTIPPELFEELQQSLSFYGRPRAQWAYGTAGFRGDPSELAPIVHRCGVFSALHCLSVASDFRRKNPQATTQPLAPVAAVITASHNPVHDNGIKLIDQNGNLLEQKLELILTRIVNAPGSQHNGAKQFLKTAGETSCNPSKDKSQDIYSLAQEILRVAVEFDIDWEIIGDSIELNANCRPIHRVKVFLARDTRPSSKGLSDVFLKGVESLGVETVDLGVLTTPQLQLAVMQASSLVFRHLPPCISGFYKNFVAEALRRLLQECRACDRLSLSMERSDKLYLDGANGVGGIEASCIQETLQENLGIELVIRNSGASCEDPEAILNLDCGADHVQRLMRIPRSFGPNSCIPPSSRCCSIDGDGDRLVYFSLDSNNKLQLCDGDRIAAVLILVIVRILSYAFQWQGHIKELSLEGGNKLRVGLVQTAYANGANTEFMSNLMMNYGVLSQYVDFEVACTKTGVKHLHAKAKQFDLGVFFEANGHGTICVDHDRLLAWASAAGISKTAEFSVLECFLALFNDSGDALLNIVAVECAMRLCKTSLKEWIQLYKDYPSLQKTVSLSRENLNKLIPHPAHEKYLKEPKGLQEAIDEQIYTCSGKCGGKLRAFVRPSGTENVCRIYTEAPDEELCKEIADKLTRVIQDYAY